MRWFSLIINVLPSLAIAITPYPETFCYRNRVSVRRFASSPKPPQETRFLVSHTRPLAL